MQKEREQNLIIVAALDKFSEEQGISLKEAVQLFKRYNLFNILRDNYDTLHTQDIFEGARFARDYIAKVTT